MKIRLPAFIVCLVPLSPFAALAQGQLTPSGPPGPTFKTLQQIEPRTPISALPFPIGSPGSYYLTTNLTGSAGTNGITIAASGVTLDLSGFALIGVAGSQAGISVSGDQTNLAIVNGTIQGWGGDGIDAARVNASQFERLRISTNSGVGIFIIFGTGSALTRCTAFANGADGIDAGYSALVEDCTVSQNAGDGIYGSGCIVKDCASIGNGASGIYIYNGSKATHCLAENNGRDGIALGYFCHALDNTCIGNNGTGNAAFAGIRTFYDGGRIEGNHVQYSAGFGILIGSSINGTPGANWLVIKNSTRGNSATAYSYPLTGNDIGPIGKAATSVSPWANLQN